MTSNWQLKGKLIEIEKIEKYLSKNDKEGKTLDTVNANKQILLKKAQACSQKKITDVFFK